MTKHGNATILNLRSLYSSVRVDSKTARMKAVVEMLEWNRLIQRIALSEDERISKSIENPLPHIFRRISIGRVFKGSNELVGVHAGKRCSDLVWILVSENAEMIAASSWSIRRVPQRYMLLLLMSRLVLSV
jgi:hypothetical protein